MSVETRGLVLWQPWASLVCGGYKRWETRCWPTKFRGRLAIIAASVTPWAKVPHGARAFSGAFAWPLAAMGYRTGSDLPAGRILCIADLVDVVPTEAVASVPYFRENQLEPFFGDYSAGRFAWRLANVRALEHPIEVSGKQRLFQLPAAALAAIESQVRIEHGNAVFEVPGGRLSVPPISISFGE